MLIVKLLLIKLPGFNSITRMRGNLPLLSLLELKHFNSKAVCGLTDLLLYICLVACVAGRYCALTPTI